MSDNCCGMDISVSEFYADKTVFITGGSGFIGKVLIEKLLRCCPVRRLFLLMRPKEGKGLKARVNDLLSSRVFDNIRQQPKIFEKLHVIRGDILQDNLGMSDEDRRLVQEETNIVFHSAACVKFDMFIRDAVQMNVIGTQRVLDLVEDIHNLEVLVHLSTTYCRSDLPVLEETVTLTRHTPEDIIHITKWMDHDMLKHLEPKLIHPEPNTYGYTKALSEQLVARYSGRFPVCIARPSIVVASLKEPFPGWVDNINGPTAIIVGAAKGVIRSMHCDDTLVGDGMPVDQVVNGCVLLAYTTALTQRTNKELVVCNIARGGVNAISWGKAVDIAKGYISEYPPSAALWYPGGSPKRHKLHHDIAVFFTHIIPAYLLDFVLQLAGQKPFLVHVQKRVNHALGVFQCYSTRPWIFSNKRYMELSSVLSKEDNQQFYTDLKSMDWHSYLKEYVRGTREYYCKEDPATLPEAKRLHSMFHFADCLLKMVVLMSVLYSLYLVLQVVS